MNLRISFFICAISLIGHSSSAVIDIQPDLSVFVDTGKLSVSKPIEQLSTLQKVATEEVGVSPKVVETILNSHTPAELVQVSPADSEVVLKLDPVVPAVGTIVDAVKNVASETVEGIKEKVPTVEVALSVAKRGEPVVEKALDNAEKEVDISADKAPASVVVEKSTPGEEAISIPVAPGTVVVENSAPVAESTVSLAPEGIVSAAPKTVVVENSAPVAEGIVSVASPGTESISTPVSALSVEAGSPDPEIQLEKESVEVATPLGAEIKAPLVPVSAPAPVYPSVSVSPHPDVGAGLPSRHTASPSNIKSADRFRYKAQKEKRLMPVEVSKNIYRTEEGDLVRLEIIERSAVKLDESPYWVKVAPLPYPPKTVLVPGFPRSSHTNIKYTSVPASTPVKTPSSERASRKLYSPLKTNPRARFGLSPTYDQQYVTPADPEVDCANGNERCFFMECLYDNWGYAIYCW